MDYEKWYSTYFEEASAIKKYIRKLKTQSNTACGHKLTNIDTRIKLLYAMYLNLIHTGKHLKIKYEVMKDCEKKSYH